jgi:MFS family permease
MNRTNSNHLVRYVFLIALTYQIMMNATRPLVSLYASDMGASTATIGLLASTYAFFPLLFAIHIGKMSDRFGIRIPVVFGTIGLLAAMAFPYLYPSLWSMYVSQALVGVSQIFINVSLQNSMGMSGEKETRDRNFSIFSLGISSGGLIGPLVGGVVGEHLGYAATFLASTAFGIIPIILSLFLPGKLGISKEKKPTSEMDNFPTYALLKSPVLRQALATSMLVLYSRDIYMAYFPLYANSVGITASGIGLILTIQGGASVAVRWALSWMTGKWGRNNIMFFSLLAAGISFVAVPFFEMSYWFWGLAVLLGAGLGCGQPLSMAITYEASPTGRTGEALGLRLAFNRLSQVVAPLLFALIGGVGGLAVVFFTSGAFLVGGSFLTKEKRKGETLDEPNKN